MNNQIKAFILPFIALVLIPAILLFDFSANAFQINFYLPFVGFVLFFGGLAAIGSAVKIMAESGKKTAALWDDPVVLISSGLYGYIRNPMIGGALLVLLGEAAIFGSLPILVWAFLFFILNDLYFRFVEEPVLEKKFGQKYAEYKNNVPKWLPRIKTDKKQN